MPSLNPIRNGPVPLRSGQIIQGKVLKLYPENKAEISLGGNRFVAKLEVGLELGARYHFQVTANASMLQLRVLGDQLKREETTNLAKLLKSLGIKSSKQNLQLLQLLTNYAIPFDKAELQSAIQLLKGEKNSGLASMVLFEMILKKLPITESTFQSLLASKSTSISEELTALKEHSSSNLNFLTSENRRNLDRHFVNTERQLLEMIDKLTEKPVSFRDGLLQYINTQNKSNNDAMYRILKGLGFISHKVDFTTWVKEWSHFTGKNLTNPTNQLPIQLNDRDILRIFYHIDSRRNEFTKAVQLFLDKWTPRIMLQQSTGNALSGELLNSLQSELKQHIFPFIPQNHHQTLNSLLQSQQNILAVYRGLQALNNGEHLDHILRLARTTMEQENFLELSTKEKFIEHIRQSYTMLGLDYEHRLATEKVPSNLQQTIKGLLLQLIGGQEYISQDQYSRLLNVIQGVQIQSVNDTATFVQAALQLPAERLGLVNDLALEFEGKKNEDGEIDPDYCRIIFYLELEKLKETVIDVNIQQRAVAITVFNNTKGLPVISKQFKEKLETGLDALNYRLFSIQFRKLEEKEKHSIGQEAYRRDDSQGVDFRI